MKKNLTSSQPERRLATSQGPARKSVLILTAFIGLGVLALVVIALYRGRPAGQSAGSPVEDGQAPESSGVGGVAPDRASPNSSSVRIRPESVPLTLAAPLEPDPTENARQLVKSLSEVNLQPGQLT